MRAFKRLKQRRKSRAFKLLLAPIFERFKSDNELESRGYRPLQREPQGDVVDLLIKIPVSLLINYVPLVFPFVL
jgi:hypothetical protein